MVQEKDTRAANVLLQARDLKTLEFLAKVGVASDKHIMQLLGITDINNYLRMIRRLILAKYVEKQKLIAGDYTYLWLGRNGARLLSASKIKKLVLNTLRHDMLVLDVYFDLLSKNPDYQIMSERELRIATGFKVGDIKKVPDLLVNDRIAIEVELSEKSHARLIDIIGNYIRDTKLEAVHYFVRSRALGNKILELAGRHKKLKVFLLDIKSKDLSYIDISNEIVSASKAVSNSPGVFNLDQYLDK